MLIKLTRGVNFIHILLEAFTCPDPKSANKTTALMYFFALLGSAWVNVARKMLMKLTRGWPSIRQTSWVNWSGLVRFPSSHSAEVIGSQSTHDQECWASFVQQNLWSENFSSTILIKMINPYWIFRLRFLNMFTISHNKLKFVSNGLIFVLLLWNTSL